MAVELYKPEEATRSRGLLAVMMAALLGYGVFSLYDYLGGIEFWQADLTQKMFGEQILGDEFPLSARVILAMVVMTAVAIGIWLICNRPKIVDFLIETEKELHKVSWAPKHEVISSSVVVVVCTVVIGVYLAVVDYLLIMVRNDVPWDSFWDRVLK